MKILLVYPLFPDTFWSFKHAIKFIDKKAANPPLGLVTVAAMLPEDWDIDLVDLNVTPLTDEKILWADLVFISAMTVQRESVDVIVERCQNLNRKIAAGGPLFTCEPEDYSHLDYLILNEGEITIPPFIQDLQSGSPKPVYTTLEYADVSLTPVPRFELLEMDEYDAMSIQYSRGCPYQCEFCNVTSLFGHTPRVKSAKQIVAELDYLYTLGWRRNIFIVDDNFIGNKKHIKTEILPAIIEWRKNKEGCSFITEVSVNLADDKELMQLMADAGFISVFVGIETPSEEGLKECHKSQNTKRDLLQAVHTMQQYGMQVMAGFIVGFDSDTPTIFQSQFDFIQESGIVTAMVGILQAPKGTLLYDRLAADGRIKLGFSGDNGDGETNIIPRMDLHTLKHGYIELVRKLFSAPVVYQRIKVFLKYYLPQRAPVRLSIPEMKAFFRALWWIGVLSDARFEFWKLIFWTLTHVPKKFPLAVTMSIYAHHFNVMSQQHLKEEPQNVSLKVGSQSLPKLVITNQSIIK